MTARPQHPDSDEVRDQLPANACARCARVLTGSQYDIAAMGPMKHLRRWPLCEACWLVVLAVLQEELLNGAAWGRRLLDEQHKRTERVRRRRHKADP